MPVLTLDGLKTHLSIPLTNTNEDDVLTTIVDSANEYIEHYCDRVFDEQTHTEYINGNSRNTVMLRNYPVSSVTELNYDPSRDFAADTVVDSEDYYLDQESGLIELYNQNFYGIRSMKCVYTAGYTTIPGDLNRAGLILGEFWYRHRARAEVGITSKTKQNEIVNFLQIGVPNEVRIILDLYRKCE